MIDRQVTGSNYCFQQLKQTNSTTVTGIWGNFAGCPGLPKSTFLMADGQVENKLSFLKSWFCPTVTQRFAVVSRQFFAWRPFWIVGSTICYLLHKIYVDIYEHVCMDSCFTSKYTHVQTASYVHMHINTFIKYMRIQKFIYKNVHQYVSQSTNTCDSVGKWIRMKGLDRTKNETLARMRLWKFKYFRSSLISSKKYCNFLIHICSCRERQCRGCFVERCWKNRRFCVLQSYPSTFNSADIISSCNSNLKQASRYCGTGLVDGKNMI